MLPESVIASLKSGSNHCAAQFKEASVLFIEIDDFAALSANLSADELVELLNFVFTVFDDALEAFGSSLYKAGAYPRARFSST
jgi:class 3 adenylate cyclase